MLPLHVLLAPVLAVLTVIGSMGNGPLAAILAEHGIVFGAIMAFLYSDFVVPQGTVPGRHPYLRLA